MKGEAELVLRARQGDQAAFGQLVERHWSRVVRLARSVVGEAEAEDVAQDSLLHAWTKLATLREPDAFGQWLSRLAVRICFKRARRGRHLFQPLDAATEPSTESNPQPRIDVARLVALLPPRQRAVMHLTVVEGMTDSEIGAVLGIAPGSVRAHRHRARQRLGKEISPGEQA